MELKLRFPHQRCFELLCENRQIQKLKWPEDDAKSQKTKRKKTKSTDYTSFYREVNNYLTTNTSTVKKWTCTKLCSMAFSFELFKYIWYSEEKKFWETASGRLYVTGAVWMDILGWLDCHSRFNSDGRSFIYLTQSTDTKGSKVFKGTFHCRVLDSGTVGLWRHNMQEPSLCRGIPVFPVWSDTDQQWTLSTQDHQRRLADFICAVTDLTTKSTNCVISAWQMSTLRKMCRLWIKSWLLKPTWGWATEKIFAFCKRNLLCKPGQT